MSNYCESVLKSYDLCSKCKYAIRYELYEEAKSEGLNIVNCKIYSVTNFEAYSDIEKAILQILKCNNCKSYYDTISKIMELANQIPYCFKTMNEVSNGYLSRVPYEIEEVLKSAKYCKCKEKIVLNRIINEYLVYNPSEEVDYEKICEFVKKRTLATEFYVHPLTIKYLMEKK